MSRRNQAFRAWKLTILLVVAALVLSSCELTVSATQSPGTTVGSTVFALLRWRTQNNAIDVVFVPDDDYGDLSNVANRQAFLDDIANLIDEGYWQNNGLASNLGLYNFWYMTLTGNATAGTGICPNATWPNLTDAAFAEVILLVHPNNLRDCRWGNRATTEPTSYNTVVHESSHAMFNLPDEYCCDGGYRNMPPVLYTSAAACNADPVNATWRNCQSFTANNGTVWWRSEDATVDIMSAGGATVLEYGQADWVIARNVLAGLPGASVSDPTVFAPAAWDWP